MKDVSDDNILWCPGFVHARNWLQDVREHADPHLTCILVGNKIDLIPSDPSTSSPSTTTTSLPSSDPTSTPTPTKSHSHHRTSSRTDRKREVPTSEAAAWAESEGLLFVEASAKSGENVERAFEEACKDILSKVKGGVFDDDRVSPLFLPFGIMWKLIVVDAESWGEAV